MRLAAHWSLLGEPEVRQLGVEFLADRERERGTAGGESLIDAFNWWPPPAPAAGIAVQRRLTTNRVEQDVGGLEVPVDDGAVGPVEEGEAPGDVQRDGQPRRPRQAAGAAEQVVLQAALGHELVHQQPVVVLAAVADELHQVRVAVLPEVAHLRLQACRRPWTGRG